MIRKTLIKDVFETKFKEDPENNFFNQIKIQKFTHLFGIKLFHVDSIETLHPEYKEASDLAVVRKRRLDLILVLKNKNMKQEEFLKFEPKLDIVLLRATPIHGGIILVNKENKVDIDTHVITVLKVGEQVKSMKPGDVVIPAGASLVSLPISDLPVNEYLMYTKESMIKFVSGA